MDEEDWEARLGGVWAVPVAEGYSAPRITLLAVATWYGGWRAVR